MFTWICPQCGREVPPSYTECPDCVARQKQAGAATAQAGAAPTAAEPGAPVAVAPPPPAVAPPAAAPYAAPTPYAAPPAAVAAPRAALPTWLLSIIFALAFIGLGAGIYFAVQHMSSSGQPAVASVGQPALQTAGARGSGQVHPLQKYIEVTGVRFLENAKKETEVRFSVVNHSGAEVADLAANVGVFGRTQKSGEEAVGRFSFKLPSLGPYESKDVTAPLDTKLRAYELPDWQNVVTDIQITAP